MSKKNIQLMLFMAVVFLGLFLIELSLQGLPVYCNCINDSGIIDRCDMYCAGHGGCLIVSVQEVGCKCGAGKCECTAVFDCEDYSHGAFFVYDENCPDC